MQRLLVVLGVAVLGIVGYLIFGPDDGGGARSASPSLQLRPGSIDPTELDPVAQPAALAAEVPAERPLLAVEPVLEPARPVLEATPSPAEAAIAAPIEAAPGEPSRSERPIADDRPAGAATRGGAIERSGCRVSLNRMFLARSVDNREPVGVDSVFSSDDERVYVFMDVNNASGPERDMVIQWDHLDSPHTYEQRIPAGVSPRWRTWVYHTMRRPLAGSWHVRVTDDGGCAVGEMTFRATPYTARPPQSARL